MKKLIFIFLILLSITTVKAQNTQILNGILGDGTWITGRLDELDY
jgi:hypothetical protein